MTNVMNIVNVCFIMTIKLEIAVGIKFLHVKILYLQGYKSEIKRVGVFFFKLKKKNKLEKG